MWFTRCLPVVKGVPRGDGRIQLGVAFAQVLVRCFPLFVAVGTGVVDVAPVGAVLVPVLGGAVDVFTVEDLVLLLAMDGFDIALPRVGFGRVVVLAAAQGALVAGLAPLVVVFEDLGAVVGLPLDLGEGAAVPRELGADPFSQVHGVAFGAFVGFAGEAEAADGFPVGVLEQGQAQAAHLGPVIGDVLAVLGVGADLLEQTPLGFDGAQGTFGGVLLLAGTCQAMSAVDALDGADAARDAELDFEACGAEAGLLAQAHDQPLDTGWDLERRLMGASGAGIERAWGAGAIAAKPFAHGVARASEGADGSLDAVGAGMSHELLAQLMTFSVQAIPFVKAE